MSPPPPPPPQERLPCQFASVDLFDTMGTALTNVTKDISKFRVAPDTGHLKEFYVEAPRAVKRPARPAKPQR